MLSFGLSFIFALGGVGSAVVLIPTLTWLEIPFNLARPTGNNQCQTAAFRLTYPEIKWFNTACI
ncbi:MAG: hypothetical protein QM498_01460 [Desulfobacterium sp.]